MAAVYFALPGAVTWGAKLAHVLGRRFVRGFVIFVGLAMTIALFLKR